MATTELYNTTLFDNATNPLDVFVAVGTAVGNQYLIGNLMLLAFFLVFLVLSFRNDFLQVLMIDGFITTILAILLAFAGMVSFITISFPAVLFFIVMLFYLFS